MKVYDDEIFGPVLSVVRVETYDEAVELINAQPVRQRHGDLHPGRRHRPAVRGRHRGRAWSASTCRSRCRSARYSFGGWKNSLFGDSHIYGPESRALLHARQGRDHPLARPHPLAGRPRLPEQPLNCGADPMTDTSTIDLSPTSTPTRACARDDRGARLPLVERAGGSSTRCRSPAAQGSTFWDYAGNSLPRLQLAAGQPQPRAPASGSRRGHPAAGRPSRDDPAVDGERRARRARPPDRRGRTRGHGEGVLHQRRRRRERERRAHGAHRDGPPQGAVDVPQLPRQHVHGDRPHRRPAPLAERARRRLGREVLRAVPVPLGLPRLDARGGGAARARAPRADHHPRGRVDDRRDRDRDDRRHQRRARAAARLPRRGAASCATGSASSTSPTRSWWASAGSANGSPSRPSTSCPTSSPSRRASTRATCRSAASSSPTAIAAHFDTAALPRRAHLLGPPARLRRGRRDLRGVRARRHPRARPRSRRRGSSSPRLRDMATRHPSVGDVRGIGLFWAIELVRDRETREPLVPFNASGADAAPVAAVAAACKRDGVWPFTHFNRAARRAAAGDRARTNSCAASTSSTGRCPSPTSTPAESSGRRSVETLLTGGIRIDPRLRITSESAGGARE